MTKGELLKALEDLPDDTPIVSWDGDPVGETRDIAVEISEQHYSQGPARVYWPCYFYRGDCVSCGQHMGKIKGYDPPIPKRIVVEVEVP